MHARHRHQLVLATCALGMVVGCLALARMPRSTQTAGQALVDRAIEITPRTDVRPSFDTPVPVRNVARAAAVEIPVAPAPPATARQIHAPAQDPRALLHVLDAATGAPLRGLVVALGHANGGAVGGPGWRVVGSDLTSPIALESLDLLEGRRSTLAPAVHRYWVRADGYAWRDVVIDHREGGTAEITLRPGADVVVAVSGSTGHERLRLAPLDGASDLPTFEQRILADGPLVVAGAEPTLYSLVVDSGGVGSTVVTALELAVPSTGAALALDVSVEADAPVRLFGDLRIAEAWGEPSGRLVLRRPGSAKAIARKRLEQLERRDDVLLWDVGEVEPGEYELVLDAYRHCTRVTVASDDSAPSGVRLVVAEPAQVEVQVVSSASKAPVSVAALRWSVEGVGSARRGARVEPDRDGVFTLSVPAGRIVLEASNGAADTARGTLICDVEPGANRVVVEIDPTAQIELQLRDAWGPLAWDARRHRVRLVHCGTGEERTSRESTVAGLAPGTYDIHLDAGGAFAAVATVTIEVESGRQRRVDVRLVAALR